MDHLLEEEKDSLLGRSRRPESRPNGVPKSQVWMLSAVAVFSITLNILQFINNTKICGQSALDGDEKLSHYAALRDETLTVPWDQQSIYTDNNSSAADAAWDAIDHDSGIVAVEKSWALDKGLPLGSDFPWDNSKSLYFVNAYHGLHCLKNIYWAFKDYRDGRTPAIGHHHITHCLDQLRADVLCNADDTLRVTTPDHRPVTGEGQHRKCRNWDALQQWTLDHPGCFRYGNPIVEDEKTDQIPRLKYCPEGSRELENVRIYFGKGPDWVPTDEPRWSWNDMMSPIEQS